MTILPLNIWYNGQIKTAEEFKLRIVGDDLETQATFFYELIETDEPVQYVVAYGNVSITGTDYTTWKSQTDTNAYAYTWVAAQLNLTID